MKRPSAVKHASPDVWRPGSLGAARKEACEDLPWEEEVSWMRDVWAMRWPEKASRRRCPVGRFVPKRRLLPLLEKDNLVNGGIRACGEL